MSLPPIISLVPERFEDGGWAGVARFDYELRRALPEMQSFNTRLRSRLRLRAFLRAHPDTIVIAASESSVLVPRDVRTIVCYHGVAQTHFDRDPHWRGPRSRRLCRYQQRMFTRPNRWFVSYARWTAQQFAEHYGVPVAPVIPNWVEPLERPARPPARPVILGDWRTFNKGRETVAALTHRFPEYEFRPLKCTYETRHAAYAAADAYLCLSLSEGGSYALSDAEAARLPIVTTDVGNAEEYRASQVIPWRARDDLDLVGRALQRALGTPRGPSFFDEWTLARWSSAWRALVSEVAASSGRPPLLG